MAETALRLAVKDFSSLTQGEVTVTATARDFYGNAISATDTSFIDTLASIDDEIWDDQPQVSITASIPEEIWSTADEIRAQNDGILNAEQIKTVTFNGVTSNIELGQSLFVTVEDGNGLKIGTLTVIRADGSYEFPVLDLSSMIDGDLTITTTSKDVAGNLAQFSTTLIKDTQASSRFTFDDAFPYSLAEIPFVSLSGDVTDIEPDQKIFVTLQDSAGAQVEYDVVRVQNDGTWQTGKLDLSGLAEGTLTATLHAVDASGNYFTTQTQTYYDASVQIDIDTSPDSLDITALRAGNTVTIKGSTDAEAGQIVLVTFSDPIRLVSDFQTFQSDTARDFQVFEAVVTDGGGYSICQ